MCIRDRWEAGEALARLVDDGEARALACAALRTMVEDLPEEERSAFVGRERVCALLERGGCDEGDSNP